MLPRFKRATLDALVSLQGIPVSRRIMVVVLRTNHGRGATDLVVAKSRVAQYLK